MGISTVQFRSSVKEPVTPFTLIVPPATAASGSTPVMTTVGVSTMVPSSGFMNRPPRSHAVKTRPNAKSTTSRLIKGLPLPPCRPHTDCGGL
jgi:hypothetical protein